jgi:hypothetical protein
MGAAERRRIDTLRHEREFTSGWNLDRCEICRRERAPDVLPVPSWLNHRRRRWTSWAERRYA